MYTSSPNPTLHLEMDHSIDSPTFRIAGPNHPLALFPPDTGTGTFARALHASTIISQPPGPEWVTQAVRYQSVGRIGCSGLF